MTRITRNDIQRVGDEDTLLHFLEEKLNLSIPKDATLEHIALPMSPTYLGLENWTAEQIIDCQDFSGLSKVDLGERRPFLIRFKHETGYVELLRQIAESLHQKNTNPTDLFFICADEHFQPFAFAYFNNSESKNWQTTVLTIRTWTEDNTHIITSDEHELPSSFFPKNGLRPRVYPVLPDDLLRKLKNTGKSLSYYAKVHTGILTGFNEAYVINEFKRQQLIDQDNASSDLIKPILQPSQKWKTELRYLIWIPTSENRHWPWSDARGEAEAKRIFKKMYPAISAHLDHYEEPLERRGNRGKFYWEFTKNNPRSMPKQSKILYPYSRKSIQAAYDTSEALPLFANHFIPTEDLTLLAILNSRLFDWYVQQTRRTSKSNRSWTFKVAFMKSVRVAPRTEAQKADLSYLVQQILDAPDSPNVCNLEEEIDRLVYDLYDLTSAEIALIEKGHNA